MMSSLMWLISLISFPQMDVEISMQKYVSAISDICSPSGFAGVLLSKWAKRNARQFPCVWWAFTLL